MVSWAESGGWRFGLPVKRGHGLLPSGDRTCVIRRTEHFRSRDLTTAERGSCSVIPGVQMDSNSPEVRPVAPVVPQKQKAIPVPRMRRRDWTLATERPFGSPASLTGQTLDAVPGGFTLKQSNGRTPMKSFRARLSVLPILCAGGVMGLGACASMPGMPTLELNRAQANQGGATFSEGVGMAVTTPLDDLNLRRQAVPEILIAARAAPYATVGLRRCSDVIAQIDDLDEALGPDVDQPVPAIGTGDQAANVALDMVRDTATDFIPLRSWVRRLSGAAAHDRAVQAAIRAGLVRRGFLKGIAQQRRCARA